MLLVRTKDTYAMSSKIKMKTLHICRHLPQKISWTQQLFAHKVCQVKAHYLFQSDIRNPVNVYQHGGLSHCCHRFFCTSRNSYIFWKIPNKVPAHQKVTGNTQQHDGRSLLDRYIFVKTLYNFYADVPNGIILDTAYADSRPGDDFDTSVPVVVGLHDTPGSHHDLVPLLSNFAKMGCRTIAPTFPGHGDTLGMMSGFDDVFSQSTIEKATFIQDFLVDLGIDRVDLLVGVGAACYPMMHLCVAETTSKFYRSMAVISPWPFQRPRYEPNQELTKRISDLWDRPFFRTPIKMMLPAYKVGEIEDSRDKITAAYLLNNLDLAEASMLALAVGSMNLPRVVVYGEMDHAVEKELYLDVLDRLSIPNNNVSVFKGRLDSPRLPGALVFPDEGYDLHRKQAGVVSAFLLELVQLFHPQIRF
uniref:AB hydrolase-1 domain-containing protein n=1 Tax=Arion vulgaris TaxID=1028688 RepID=A0A0B6ZSU4_9EUPU